MIYYVSTKDVYHLGFPRIPQSPDPSDPQPKRKLYVWKRMNFITKLPKYDPVVNYVVASATAKGKTFRMHMVWKEKNNSSDGNGLSDIVLCHILSIEDKKKESGGWDYKITDELPEKVKSETQESDRIQEEPLCPVKEEDTSPEVFAEENSKIIEENLEPAMPLVKAEEGLPKAAHFSQIRDHEYLKMAKVMSNFKRLYNINKRNTEMLARNRNRSRSNRILEKKSQDSDYKPKKTSRDLNLDSMLDFKVRLGPVPNPKPRVYDQKNSEISRAKKMVCLIRVRNMFKNYIKVDLKKGLRYLAWEFVHTKNQLQKSSGKNTAKSEKPQEEYAKILQDVTSAYNNSENCRHESIMASDTNAKQQHADPDSQSIMDVEVSASDYQIFDFEL